MRGKTCTYVLNISDEKNYYINLKINGTATLYKLHSEIIKAFKFEDNHSHAFFMNNCAWNDEYSYYSDFVEDAHNYSSQVQLDDFNLEKDDKFLYIFNFGNELRVNIKVLDIKNETITEPQIIKRVGKPPFQED